MQNFQVLTRVRPLTNKEKEQIAGYQRSHFNLKHRPKSQNKSFKLAPNAYSFLSKFYNCNINEILKVDGNSVYVADPEYKNTEKKMKQFTFSNVFDIHDSNHKIFTSCLSQQIDEVIKGFNCTILSYGITGSGKTHTVFGNSKVAEDTGISYLACNHLLELKNSIEENGGKVDLRMSFIQIYNQNIRDLLSSESKYLQLLEDIKGTTSLPQLTELKLNTAQQAQQLLGIGSSRRVFASTVSNQYSSRSHAILQLNVQITTSSREKLNSKLYIIDLAGSQKLQLNSNKKNNEGANINRSLLALGNCINVLAENHKKAHHSHIPYRDSKLTRLLKDSLGGNTKTVMIACISLNPFTIQETMTTLNYAYRAQGIKKNVYKNQDHNQQIICIHCNNKIQLPLRQTEKNKNPKQQEYNQLNEGSVYADEQGFEELFGQIYDDIIDNIRQNQKIKSYGTVNDGQWTRIKSINQDQGIILRQTMLALIKKKKEQIGTKLSKSGKISSEQINEHKQEQLRNQNEEKQEQKQTQTFESLRNTYLSGRKRSRNKLQSFKRNSSKPKQAIINQGIL